MLKQYAVVTVQDGIILVLGHADRLSEAHRIQRNQECASDILTRGQVVEAPWKFAKGRYTGIHNPEQY